MMMKLYHYVPKETKVMSVGILSVSKVPKELLKYGKRAGSEKPKEIISWLEGTFPGRSKAISVLTEPLKWKGNDPMLKEWVKTKKLISIDFSKLLKSGLIEAIWCKNGSNADGFNEQLYQIQPEQIDISSLPWEKCSQEKGLFFGVIRHYLLVMKNGFIPPEFLKEIKRKTNETVSLH